MYKRCVEDICVVQKNTDKKGSLNTSITSTFEGCTREMEVSELGIFTRFG